MKKYYKAAASFLLAVMFTLTAAQLSFAAPNLNAVLWREFTPGNDGAYIQRLGHKPDGTPYMVFAQLNNTGHGPSDTHWSSNNTTTEHWLEITFSGEKTFDRINLYFFENDVNKYPWESFTISYWKDNEWKTFIKKEKNAEMMLRYSFCGVTSQKVRIDITKPSIHSNDKYARLREIEIFDDTGKNIAASNAGATIAADSTVSSKRAASCAIDGYAFPELGYWSPAAKTAPPHWIVLDFGEEKQFDEIKVVEVDDVSYDGKEAGFEDYQLQYNAGTYAEPNWVDVAKVTGNKRSSAHACFESVTARQVRMYITKTRSGDSIKIAGFRVYNRAAGSENIAENAIVSVSSQDKALGGLSKFVLSNGSTQQITCLTAYDLEGNKLWQKGTPKSNNRTIGSDLPIQIFDIDNDGEEEIITVYNDSLQVLSYDGTVEKEVSCYLQADCLMPVNVSGNETMQDILVKDRYKEVAVYDKDLNLLWSRYQTNTAEDNYRDLYGHFPYPCDIDNDGKDEILVGAVLLDDDGSLLHRYVTNGTFISASDGKTHYEIAEHSDGMKIADLDPENEGLEMVSAYSSAGTMFMDTQGNRLVTDTTVGHAQKVVVGEFAPTVPGLEVFTSTKPSPTNYQLYLNRGNGEKLWNSPISYGSSSGVIQMDPSFFVKAGSGQEHLLISKGKGLFDSDYKNIVTLNNVLTRFGYSVNIGGDEREELLFWNEGAVQIWTNTAAVPDGGKNIARDAQISVDSTYDNNYSAAALNDGNRNGSVWKSLDAGGGRHYITVDFGAAKTFDELWLYGYSDETDTYLPKNFKIQYNSGTTESPAWVTIHDVTNNQKKAAAFTFNPVTAQQVRIYITNPTTALNNVDNAARIFEIEIYEALTEFSPVSGESAENSITFNSAKRIDGAQLDFSGEVKDFKLQYLSGGEWKDILSTLCNSAATQKYAFSPVETSALRVVVTDGSGSAQISAREYSGYSYTDVVNEVIVNPTKSGNTGSYRWTNY